MHDSVAYGVGAGYPYRVTELAQAAAPLSNTGTWAAVWDHDSRRIESLAWSTRLISLRLNMNDIHPPVNSPEFSSSEKLVRWIRQQVDRIKFTWPQPFLYSFVRILS